MITRLIAALALTTLFAVPSAASAQARKSSSGGTSPVALTGLLGFESGDTFDGLQLRGDLDVGLVRLAPRFQLAGVGSISYARLSHETNSWEFIPAARFVFDATPQVGVYGDVGLGIFHISNSGGSDTGATMRFSGGGTFAVAPRLRLVAEIGLHPHWGDYDETTFTLLGGLRFNL